MSFPEHRTPYPVPQITFTTADLYDAHESDVQVALPGFRDYGGRKRFYGPVSTAKVFEDNSVVRSALEETGAGRVLVVDGGESMRCALAGDRLAQIARDNGWSGIVVSGCIRDAAVITGIDIGLKALGTNPRKSVKQNSGERDVQVRFSGITINPGDYVYADEDGILVSAGSLF